MKIAFIHNLPSGGGKRSAFEFVRSLSRRHAVDLFHIEAGSENYLDLRPMTGRSVLVPGPVPRGGLGVLTNQLSAARAYRRIATQVNVGGYDLAFVMQCRMTNTPAVLRHLTIPSLYYCHEPLERTLEEHFWRAQRMRRLKRGVVGINVAIDRMNAQHATMICANSRFSVESIYHAYGRYARYCQLGVDTATFRPLGLSRESSVLSVGALHPVKAQDLIIEALGTLSAPPPLHFVHNSSARGYKEHLIAVAARCGVTVTFSQLVGEEDLVAAYNRAAVVAFPSSMEPFGFVPLEAMACGAAVVGVAEGGVRETIVHGRTGLLAERNAEAYGQALAQVLRDRDYARRLGEAGREHVLAHWTWEQSALRIEELVHAALGERSVTDGRVRSAIAAAPGELRG